MNAAISTDFRCRGTLFVRYFVTILLFYADLLKSETGVLSVLLFNSKQAIIPHASEIIDGRSVESAQINFRPTEKSARMNLAGALKFIRGG